MLSFLVGLLMLIPTYCLPAQYPVIGVYTQNVSLTLQIKQTYITETYIQFLEMSGAMVIPLFYNQSQTRLLSVLKQINGVLFTGGEDYDLNSTYVNNADFILKYAIEQNKNGNTFPIWGTCLGHQLLSYLTSGYDPKVLKKVNGEIKVNNNITILNRSSEFFNNWQPRHFKAAQNGNGIAFFSHSWAIYTDYFKGNENLSNFWDLVATTTSAFGEQFVSMQKAKDYPFYSVQFHPEMNVFNWIVDVNKTAQGIEIPQMLSNLFVEQSRKSKNRFESINELNNILIWNYELYDGIDYGFKTMAKLYIFNQPNEIARLDKLQEELKQQFEEQV